MTTVAFSTPQDHTTDAGFRAWGLEFAAALASAGLVQEADTGQINWSTVNRAASSSDAGYEIWRFDDTLQATAPIFLRVVYCTAQSTDEPQIKIQVGTGTNGAGTITGTAQTITRETAYQFNTTNKVAPLPSYFCAVEGFFGFYWKDGANPTQGCNGCFMVCRTCNPTTGAPDANGAHVFWSQGNGGSSAAHQALRFASPAAVYDVITGAPRFCMAPHVPNSSFDGTDFQAYQHYTIFPGVNPLFGQCTVRSSEIAVGSTFSVAMVGSTPRTYIALRFGQSGNGAGLAEASSNSPYNYSMAMLWE